MTKTIIKSSMGAALAVCLAAGAAGSVEAQEIYVTGGTLGGGLGGAYNFNSHFGIHADAEYLGFAHTVNVNGNDYDGHLSLKQGGLYLDLFPFASSGFRVTGGAIFNDDTLKARAVPNSDGNYKIGNDYVPAVGGAPEATAKMPTVMPYLGIGYGHKRQTPGFGFMFDLGVAYGRPKVSYNIPQIYTLFTSQQNIIDQENQINDKVRKYRWYPVVQIGVTYRF